MSEDKPSSTEAKTIIGTEGSGAHRRPLAPSEYSMHKPASRFEQSGLLRPNAAGTGSSGAPTPAGPSERTRRPSDAPAPPAGVTTIMPNNAAPLPSTPGTLPQGTPAPIAPNATLAGQPRSRRGSQAPSLGGKSNQWDKHSDSNRRCRTPAFASTSTR